jgi:hypothetical protein
MDSKQLFIRLVLADWDALRQLAEREYRDPKQQAARLISEGVMRHAVESESLRAATGSDRGPVDDAHG